MRVELPDRPGSLGAVATALGEVGADILAMDIVERGTGVAVDDLVVEVPSDRRPDALITAAESVPGVRVESIRPDPGVANTHREWELVEAVTAQPNNAIELLAELLPEIVRSDWAAVLRTEPNGSVTTLATGGAAPIFDTLTPGWGPLTEPTHLDPHAAWVPDSWRQLNTELAGAPLGSTDVVVLVGRAGGPALRRTEVAKVGHLAMLVAMVKGRLTIG